MYAPLVLQGVAAAAADIATRQQTASESDAAYSAMMARWQRAALACLEETKVPLFAPQFMCRLAASRLPVADCHGRSP